MAINECLRMWLKNTSEKGCKKLPVRAYFLRFRTIMIVVRSICGLSSKKGCLVGPLMFMDRQDGTHTLKLLEITLR